MTKKKRSKPVRWNDDFYITIYQGILDNESELSIAKRLGVLQTTIVRWKNQKPALKKAILAARKRRKAEAQKNLIPSTTTYIDYIYEQLPEHLKKILEEIEAIDSTNPQVQMDAIFAREGLRARQHLFLHALVSENFNASRACARVGITKSSLNHWYQREPQFRELIEEIHWHKQNFFESSLIKLVTQGDSPATIFANKTFNRDRGYNENNITKTTFAH